MMDNFDDLPDHQKLLILAAWHEFCREEGPPVTHFMNYYVHELIVSFKRLANAGFDLEEEGKLGRKTPAGPHSHPPRKE